MIEFLINLIGGIIGLVFGLIGAVLGLIFGVIGAAVGLVVLVLGLLLLGPIILLLVLIFKGCAPESKGGCSGGTPEHPPEFLCKPGWEEKGSVGWNNEPRAYTMDPVCYFLQTPS